MHPGDPNVMAVRYENGGGGALITTDGGKTWKLLCNALLFDPVQTRKETLVIANDGTTLVGAFTGLWQDDGHACAWSSVPAYDGRWIAGFATDPIDPNVTYAVTSSGAQMNGMLRRDSSGKWSDFGTKDDILITELRVVPHAGGRRYYVAAARGVVTLIDGGLPVANYVIRVSDDDGAHWTEHVYGGTDGALHLEGVDPTNPDRIIVAIERAEDLLAPARTTDSVLVSSDQGATFEDYLTITEIGGVAFAPDGRAWIGDGGAVLDPKQALGLWFAPNLSMPATKLSTVKYPVQCLGYRESTDTLYACQQTTFGTVDKVDGAFTTLFDFRTVTSFVGCPGVDMAATCETQLCGAYCGIGHYAQAPVCCAYGTLTCGPAASPAAVCPIRDAGTDGADGATDASDERDGGSGGISAGGAPSASGAAGNAAGGVDDGGGGRGGGPAASAGQDGGCCAIAGRTSSGSSSAKAIALVASALVLRRRRRR